MSAKGSTPAEEVLVVDDTPENLRLLSQMLSGRGYSVRAVTSGQRAIESSFADPPDLVLLDIRMPAMDGFKVCERLKAQPQMKDVPIIFISALDALEDKMKAFSVGGVDYITKPFQIEEVMARVNTHLSLRRLQKHLEDTNQRLERELALAGSVQASFFPGRAPDIPGWQLEATLRPARETSGDFYDVIELPSGCYGLLIGDVVDKGVSAALYMAMSWTLIRTYAPEFPTQPELALGAANRRIIADSDDTRFVTVFYGILDPSDGLLTYCNAGHNPPLHVGSGDGQAIVPLEKTGVPLGVLAEESWEKDRLCLEPSDALVLYTDGVTEAQNAQGDFFGERGLRQAIEQVRGQSARGIEEHILASIDGFANGGEQSDDLAVLVLARESLQ